MPSNAPAARTWSRQNIWRFVMVFMVASIGNHGEEHGSLALSALDAVN